MKWSERGGSNPKWISRQKGGGNCLEVLKEGNIPPVELAARVRPGSAARKQTKYRFCLES